MNQRANISDDIAPKRRFTVDEFEAMGMAGIFGPNERVELLAGEIYVMSPARFHEVLRHYLADHFRRVGNVGLLIAEEMQLQLSEDFQPRVDLGVLPFALLPPDARGPDMLVVVEIADSSLKLDTTFKAAAYATGGVREYWVINARNRMTLVHREPQSDGTYAVKFEVAAEAVATPLLLPELAVRLSELPGG
jgi:Uma2 family endonuclease